MTDDFLQYVRQRSEDSDLDELSNFLLVAATLLDLKTARLLPRGEVDDELDLELLEARDLLFARLLQYRAFKSVSALFAARLADTGARVARSVPLEERFTNLLPPLVLTAGPAVIAALYAQVLQRDTSAPQVSVDHLHEVQVSVPEQRTLILGLLQAHGSMEFTDMIEDADSTLLVVARFLALLELFRAGLCAFDQAQPLGPLHVSAVDVGGSGAGAPAAALPPDDDWSGDGSD